MRGLFYISFLILLASCSGTEKKSPRFDLDQHREKFEYERFVNIDLDSIEFDFKKEPMDSLEYVSVFQKEFNRQLYDYNPCYFYSIQSENQNYTSIGVLQYHEAEYIEMTLVNHDNKGGLIDKKVIALWGGHAAWSLEMRSKYIDKVTIESIYTETDWEDTNEKIDIFTNFERREVFKLSKDGSIVTISKDSMTSQEERPW